MKKLTILLLTMLPSVALAHPGHTTGDMSHDALNGPFYDLVIASACISIACVAVTIVQEYRKQARS